MNVRCLVSRVKESFSNAVIVRVGVARDLRDLIEYVKHELETNESQVLSFSWRPYRDMVRVRAWGQPWQSLHVDTCLTMWPDLGNEDFMLEVELETVRSRYGL